MPHPSDVKMSHTIDTSVYARVFSCIRVYWCVSVCICVYSFVFDNKKDHIFGIIDDFDAVSLYPSVCHDWVGWIFESRFERHT